MALDSHDMISSTQTILGLLPLGIVPKNQHAPDVLHHPESIVILCNTICNSTLLTSLFPGFTFYYIPMYAAQNDDRFDLSQFMQSPVKSFKTKFPPPTSTCAIGQTNIQQIITHTTNHHNILKLQNVYNLQILKPVF